MTSELKGWNVDGWYDEYSAAEMAGWYASLDDVDAVYVFAGVGRHAVLYHGEPFTFDHSGRDRDSLSEDAKRRLNLREMFLPDEDDAGLVERERLYIGDALGWREVRREQKLRANPRPEPAEVAAAPAQSAPAIAAHPDQPACVTAYNAAHTWGELLGGDGWEIHHVDRDGVSHWTRPGKNRREGSSATVNLGGLDLLYVFSSGLAWLPVRDRGRGYDRWGYMVHRDFAGDFRAAVRAMSEPQKAAEPIEDLIEERKQ